MQRYYVLSPAGENMNIGSESDQIVFIQVTQVDESGLFYRISDGPRSKMAFTPLPCLAIFASLASGELMNKARDWIKNQGIHEIPAVTIIDRSSDSGILAQTLLKSFAGHMGALAKLASRQAQQISSLRTEIETLVSVRADLDRFISDVGLSQLACVFSTAEPDFETQIELTPGAPLRQLLPIVSTGLAAIDLACAASDEASAPLSVTLRLIEEDRTLAKWHVTPQNADGWLRFGLSTAYAGPARSLELLVQPASNEESCANLALGAYQPLVFAQLSDALTGEVVAPHALAFRAYAAIPGTKPPHGPETLFPLDVQAPMIEPFSLRALTAEILARVVEDNRQSEAAIVSVLHVADAATILCRSGAIARIASACPIDTRGMLVQLSVRSDRPSRLRLTVSIDTAPLSGQLGSEADPTSASITLENSHSEEISILLSRPLSHPADIVFTAEALDELEGETAWAALSNVRVIR